MVFTSSFLSFFLSYALLVVLNRSGMFTILPTHNDESRPMFSNRACCFKFLNKINPAFDGKDHNLRIKLYYILNLKPLLVKPPIYLSWDVENINLELALPTLYNIFFYFVVFLIFVKCYYYYIWNHICSLIIDRLMLNYYCDL